MVDTLERMWKGLPRTKVTMFGEILKGQTKNNGKGVCRQCEKNLELGDKIVTKLSCKKGNSYIFYYHYNCAERLHIVWIQESIVVFVERERL